MRYPVGPFPSSSAGMATWVKAIGPSAAPRRRPGSFATIVSFLVGGGSTFVEAPAAENAALRAIARRGEPRAMDRLRKWTERPDHIAGPTGGQSAGALQEPAHLSRVAASWRAALCDSFRTAA